jgi:16S rRNA (cytosine967-C5)-methyltransferase
MADRGVIVASDVRPRRLRLLTAAVARSGSQRVRVVRADVTRPLPFAPVFDRVLLDAPCSGLGTLRRDPDIKWKRQASHLAALAAAQLRMLDHVAAVLKPGGTIIYATCSSEPEENEAVVEAFLAGHAGFTAIDLPLQTLPHRDGLEAFFAARLVSTGQLR